MTGCSPAEAWRLMQGGASLADVARLADVSARDLDRELWDWLAAKFRARAGSVRHG